MVDFDKLKREVQEAERHHQRAEGVKDELSKRFVDEYDCSTAAEARSKLEGLETEADVAQLKADEAEADFREKWEAWKADEN